MSFGSFKDGLTNEEDYDSWHSQFFESFVNADDLISEEERKKMKERDRKNAMRKSMRKLKVCSLWLSFW
jgi:hypothetical protein